MDVSGRTTHMYSKYGIRVTQDAVTGETKSSNCREIFINLKNQDLAWHVQSDSKPSCNLGYFNSSSKSFSSLLLSIRRDSAMYDSMPSDS